jgi:hypothetical protein
MFGENADAMAAAARTSTSHLYIRLRPRRSAIRPKTIAPIAEVSSASEDTSYFWELLMCHSVTSIDTTTPMMNRS